MTVSATHPSLIETLNKDRRYGERAECREPRPQCYFELEAWLSKLHEKLQFEREEQALSLI